MNESAHIHNVFAFLSFFAIVFFLAWITKPSKKFSRGHICVCDTPIKPNPKRSGETWRNGDIKIGDTYDDAGILVRPEVKM